MRDGNGWTRYDAIKVWTVFELPMRDGNGVDTIEEKIAKMVFELPMRDGNGNGIKYTVAVATGF